MKQKVAPGMAAHLAAVEANNKQIESRREQMTREIAQLPNTAPTSNTVWDGWRIGLRKTTDS